MDPDEYTYPVRNSFYVNTITCIALSFATEAAVEQNSESCRWTTTQGNGEPVDHSTLSVLHEIGDDGARALAKASGATWLRRCKRRMSFKTLQLGTPFSCHVLGLRPPKKLCQIWCPSMSRVAEHSSVQQLQRLQIDSCARASTPRDQPYFFPFSQAIFSKAYSGVPTLGWDVRTVLLPRQPFGLHERLEIEPRPTRIHGQECALCRHVCCDKLGMTATTPTSPLDRAKMGTCTTIFTSSR